MTGFQQQNKKAAYHEIETSLQGLLGGALTWEAALVSLIALLKQTLPALSWVGFYRADESGHLWIGPYQGKLACVHLRPGQGVCGKAFERGATIIVEDVHTFEGHVYCDPLAASEIVVPVKREGKLVGVLDLDSHETSTFDALDQERLEALLKAIEPLPERVILGM